MAAAAFDGYADEQAGDVGQSVLPAGDLVGRFLTPRTTGKAATADIDPLHFGVIMSLNLMIGLLSPPFGVGAVRRRQDR